MAAAQFLDERLPARFWDKVQPCPISGCWLWTAALVSGYGNVSRKSPMESSGDTGAHRIAYKVLRGAIADGLVIDHLCRTPCCVNPAHMEVVTRGENVRRGEGGRNNRAKTHCPNGHEYTPANTYRYRKRGWRERICKTCHNTRRAA